MPLTLYANYHKAMDITSKFLVCRILQRLLLIASTAGATIMQIYTSHPAECCVIVNIISSPSPC